MVHTRRLGERAWVGRATRRRRRSRPDFSSGSLLPPLLPCRPRSRRLVFIAALTFCRQFAARAAIGANRRDSDPVVISHQSLPSFLYELALTRPELQRGKRLSCSVQTDKCALRREYRGSDLPRSFCVPRPIGNNVACLFLPLLASSAAAVGPGKGAGATPEMAAGQSFLISLQTVICIMYSVWYAHTYHGLGAIHCSPLHLVWALNRFVRHSFPGPDQHSRRPPLPVADSSGQLRKKLVKSYQDVLSHPGMQTD